MTGCTTPVTDAQGNKTTLGEFVTKTRQQGQETQGDGPVVTQATTESGLTIRMASGIPKDQQGDYGDRDRERYVVKIPPDIGTAHIFPTPVSGVVSPLAYTPPSTAPNLLANHKGGNSMLREQGRDERYWVHPLTPGKSNDAWPAQRGCRMVPSYVVDLDVDAMYARAMRRWRLVTPEKAGIWATTGSQHWYNKWRHDRQAGSYYRVAQSVSYGGMWQEQRSVFLDMTLSRQSANSTLVEINYCIRLHADLWDTTVESHTHLQRVLVESMQQEPSRDRDYVQGPAMGTRSTATLRQGEWKP